VLAEQHVRDRPRLELLSPASLGIICFRRSFEDVRDEEEIAELNAELISSFERTGRGLVSSTRLHGRYAIRMCVMNHTTGPDDVVDTLDWFANAPAPPRAPSPPAPRYEDHRADIQSGWGQSNLLDEPTLRAVPLFESLSERELDVVSQAAQEMEFPAGETVIRRWQGTRYFYVILTGSVEIEIADQRVAELGPGQFFGELAALDWGAGFGYVRTATVVARQDVRLLVLAPAVLDELMRAVPAVDRQIREVLRERMRRL
jgi:hypothetical protein